ncbi:MAG: beta-N-acetylhexosaminidase [Myxococcota bacterium]
MLNGHPTDEALHEAAGQMLLVGFHGTQAPPDTIRAALTTGTIGGVILFRRNIEPGVEGLWTLARLNAQLGACRPDNGPPPFIAVDQEGGRVMRVRDGVTPLPPMGKVGATGDRALVAQVGEVIAAEIGALGFNLNFAPVLDLFTNPDNTVIGDRALGRDPAVVAELAGALTVGHYMAGVVPCGKHFPGHGDTVADSHHELPVVLHGPERLEAVELIPFARAVASGIPMIMTAHILVPALDALHPMTLSQVGLQRLLRSEMGFDGVVITDDLEMKAVADRYSIEEMVELGLGAGVDIFLICHTEALWKRAYAHIIALGREHEAMRERILRSAERVRQVKERYVPKTPYTSPTSLEALRAELATPEHVAVMKAIEAFEEVE